MAPFMTHCDICDSKYTTTKALLKHRALKHRNVRSVRQLYFYDDKGMIPVPLPHRGSSSPSFLRDYKMWLSGVTESINSTLHPKVSGNRELYLHSAQYFLNRQLNILSISSIKVLNYDGMLFRNLCIEIDFICRPRIYRIHVFAGKWSRVERLDCSVQYLQLLLARLPSAFVNRIAERPHWKPPVWKRMARHISWKCYDLEEVRAAFNDSATPLVLSKSFNGEQEVAARNDAGTRLSGISAIALAKARARGGLGQSSQQPTCMASLVVGEGEGRATREFEVIWWPDLFSNHERGKLTLRYYVGKVTFIN